MNAQVDNFKTLASYVKSMAVLNDWDSVRIQHGKETFLYRRGTGASILGTQFELADDLIVVEEPSGA